MTVAVPSATAVTKPAEETVATEVLDDDHVTSAPEIAVPAASFTVAVSVAVSPTDEKASQVGESVTLDATWVTVMVAVALAGPEVAVIVTDPVAIEVTSPAAETVATVASEDDHVAVASDMTEPPASFTVAIKLAVSAIDEKVSEPGDTSSVAAT